MVISNLIWIRPVIIWPRTTADSLWMNSKIWFLFNWRIKQPHIEIYWFPLKIVWRGDGSGWEKFFGFQSGNSQNPQNWNFSWRSDFGSEVPKYPSPPTQIGTSRGELKTVWQCADHSVYRKVTIWLHTVGPTKNEYGYKYLFRKSRFLSIKIIDSNVKKFGYNEHSLARRSFFRIFLLISGTQCRRAGK